MSRRQAIALAVITAALLALLAVAIGDAYSGGPEGAWWRSFRGLA